MMSPPVSDVVRRIVEAFDPRRVVLFGSRARGDVRPDSDLDLMIEMTTEAEPVERIRMIDALFGLRDWAMDLVVYTPEEVQEKRRQRNSLLRVIESEGKVLYERPG